MTAVVFLLWHQHPEDEEGKLLGVYSSRDRASARIDEAVTLPGFRRFVDAFTIDEYEVDEDHWTTGFATMDLDGEWVEDPDPSPRDSN
ncbi:MAG: hypothetical protein R2707_11180 [Acidimicrobiales bacterium]